MTFTVHTECMSLSLSLSTYMYIYILVGGIPTPLKKYEFVSWDGDSQNLWKKNPCSKPPISICLYSYVYCLWILRMYIYIYLSIYIDIDRYQDPIGCFWCPAHIPRKISQKVEDLDGIPSIGSPKSEHRWWDVS